MLISERKYVTVHYVHLTTTTRELYVSGKLKTLQCIIKYVMNNKLMTKSTTYFSQVF